mgnify:FL=1
MLKIERLFAYPIAQFTLYFPNLLWWLGATLKKDFSFNDVLAYVAALMEAGAGISTSLLYYFFSKAATNTTDYCDIRKSLISETDNEEFEHRVPTSSSDSFVLPID